MENYDVYRDISDRTEGDIYIGVVGPVRTGKSTFIKNFMDLMVLPNIDNAYNKERVVDELPQSAAGKTIMTTQPKFVPNEAVEIRIEEKAVMNVRMVDCVGYMVGGAMGFEENEQPRMVRTPWFDYDIPFEDAAEIGTRKVITDHSTIGVVVTTDGSITDITRNSYIEAEERVVNELKELNKPFIIVLNTSAPDADDTKKLRDSIAQKYDMPVLTLDVMNMTNADINKLLETVLFEFPLKTVRMDVPEWMQALSFDHWLLEDVMGRINNVLGDISKVRDYGKLMDAFDESEYVETPRLDIMLLGEGVVEFALTLKPGLFYKVLAEECGYPIKGDYHLFSIMKDLVTAKNEYDRVAQALDSVRQTGYGLVPPSMNELSLEEPEIVQQGSRFGVKLKASAPSLHLIRVDIQTVVSPIVGTEKQSEELVKYLLSEFEADPKQIWETNIFGKSLHELVKEGLSNKLARMPEDAQDKIQITLQRIINEGSGGLICILL